MPFVATPRNNMVVHINYLKMNVIFVFILLKWIAFADCQSASPDCAMFQLPENITVTEKDEKDTVVFNISYCGSEWSMKVTSPAYVTDDYFSWDFVDEEYTLSINKTLNLEYFHEINPNNILRNVTLQFSQKGASSTLVIPVLPVNEFPPLFKGTPYEIKIPENTEVNSTVFDLNNRYTDRDTLDYITRITMKPPLIPEFDGGDYFHLVAQTVQVSARLDYEALSDFQKFFELGLVIYDTGNKSTRTDLKITIIDVDEPPVFVKSDCQRNTNNRYPWKRSGCRINNYTVYVQSSGKVTALPDDIAAIDYDIADNTIEYSFLDDNMEMFDNMSCNLAMNNSTGAVSVSCNDTGDFKQFYLDNEGMDFNLTIQATEVSPEGLNTTVVAVVHFGPPPLVTTTATTLTTTTVPPTVKSSPTPIVATTASESNQTVTVKEANKTDTTRLLIIVIPSAAGGLLLIIIIVISCKYCKSCAEDEDSNYRLEQKKIAKRQEYYAAYDNVGKKGDMDGLGDSKATVVHQNDVFISAIHEDVEKSGTEIKG